MTKGWMKESGRHSLASKGIRTKMQGRRVAKGTGKRTYGNDKLLQELRDARFTQYLIQLDPEDDVENMDVFIGPPGYGRKLLKVCEEWFNSINDFNQELPPLEEFVAKSGIPIVKLEYELHYGSLGEDTFEDVGND